MQKLKIAREKKGYSVEEMAAKLKISFYTYKSYELGTREPNIKRLKEIANILDTAVDELI